MKNRIVFWGIIICLLAGLTGSRPAEAFQISSGDIIPEKVKHAISIQNSGATVDFPAKLTFSIAVNADVNIIDIRLRYFLDRDRFASVFSESFIEFVPSLTVQTNWVMDMQKTGGLPPGATLTYWWVIKDARGRIIESTPQKVEFSDNRFLWRSIQNNTITLYWYNGSNAFANQLMTTAQQALVRLESNTGAKLVKPIRIYIYANAQDLRGSMIFPAEWTGGVAFTEYAIIAIGINPSNIAWGENAIAHELTHLTVHQMTFNPYGGLPTWLEEGLAVYNERQPDPAFARLLSQAASGNTLISIRSLSSPFSAYGNAASLSYAESYSVVEYLITTHGQQKMLALLNSFRDGNTYDEALKQVYGVDMDMLYTTWKQKIGAQ